MLFLPGKRGTRSAKLIAEASSKQAWAKRILREFGIYLPDQRICGDHHSPAEIFFNVLLQRPSIALIHGSRGSGKSYLSALETHLSSLFYQNLNTRILGGSQAQSKQIYRALKSFGQQSPRQAERIKTLEETHASYENGSRVQILTANAIETRYSNGSEVAILAASSTSVRGPHVQSLRLDEVDEIPEEIREAAIGMCMAQRGVPASVVMTSTWHRVNGSMASLIERANTGEFPYYTMCVFEVLERCPEWRSGPKLELCPACPIFQHCHARIVDGLPKAKRSNGHYSIDALIQKVRMTSLRTFESDYLCRAPRSDGSWFTHFNEETHVSESAEFDPSLKVHLAIDSGVFTGAVFFQVVPGRGSPQGSSSDVIRVFADYLTENHSAERNAKSLLELASTRCLGKLDLVSTDPAGGARNPVGPTVIGEYERAGLRNLIRWPQTSVADGLALIESFMNPADGVARLLVHPRCKHLIEALRYYRRAKRGGQSVDYPEDPQHPFEELVDSLRGGLQVHFPQGRFKTGQESFARIPARQVF